jgi:hypothetical protein
MKKAAVGFRVHSGWCAGAVACLEKGIPNVLHRERLHLVEEFTYRFRQPYHTAQKMPVAEAYGFITKVRTTATELACLAIQRLQSDLEARGYRLSGGALLLASGKLLPELQYVLASHALIHTADGELFRDAITRAHVRHGIPLACIKERELHREAEQSLGLTTAALRTRLTKLGKPLGAPWSQDEKFAALAAWLALSEKVRSAAQTNC